MSWDKPIFNPHEPDFYALFEDKVSALIVDHFLTREECQKLEKEIHKMGLREYAYEFNAEVPHAESIFDTHYLYEQKTPEEYFPKASNTISLYQKFCQNLGFDPAQKVQNYLSEQFGQEVQIATQNGHTYTYAIVRELQNSALLHADYAGFIPNYWSISNIVSQYAWNIYITDPEKGGECVVYQKLWKREDDQYIYKQTYGYDEIVVQNKASIHVPICPGRLLFFNSRNFHKVNASTKKRISIGGHVGINKNNDILMWV